MRLVIVSDTHCRHEELGTLESDVLIHCGDMLDLFDEAPGQIEAVDAWFGKQAFDLILCTGGNHDFALERKRLLGQPFVNATYLEDSGFDYHGVKFWGAPWVPDLREHAFYQSPEGLAEAWAAIPGDVDVLITHTPPYGVLDRSRNGESRGCPGLLSEMGRLNLRLHCFGHVHASAGRINKGRTEYVNASSVDSQLSIRHKPIGFDY